MKGEKGKKKKKDKERKRVQNMPLFFFFFFFGERGGILRKTNHALFQRLQRFSPTNAYFKEI